MGTLPLPTDCYQDRAVVVEHDGAPVTLLYGMGGSGKTELAAQHIRPLWDDRAVDVAMWITAVDRASVVAGYAQAARLVGCATDRDPAVAATALLNWLATTDRRWVIVLDDLRDPDHVKGLWPQGRGHTLVTTRRQDAALRRQDWRAVEIAPFTSTESLAYLRAKLADRPAHLDEAADLAQDVGHLPLALAQAAAYVIDLDITCAVYRQRFADGLDVSPDRLPDEQQHTVNTTWRLSVEQADQLKPKGVARPLLEVLSLLDPNGIPTALVRSAAVAHYLSLRTDSRIGPEDAEDALRCLRRLSLVSLDPAHADHGVRVHALVQHASRPAAHYLQAAAMTAANALHEIWPDIERDSRGSLRANTTALVHKAAEHLWYDCAHAVLFTLGADLHETGVMRTAVSFYRRLLATAREKLGDEHLDTLRIRQELAHSRGGTGDVQGAAADLEQLVTDVRRLLGPEHRLTLITRHNWTFWRAHVADPTDTVAAFRELLDDRRRIRGPDDPDTLYTQHCAAWWSGETGDVVRAITEFEQLLTCRTRVSGEDHPATLIARHGVLFWQARQHHDTMSEKLRKRTHEICTIHDDTRSPGARVLPENHPATVDMMRTIEQWRAGSIAIAERYVQLYADYVRVLGHDHPDTLAVRRNMAHHRGQSGDVGGAISDCTRLVDDHERMLPEDTPSSLRVRADLAGWNRRTPCFGEWYEDPRWPVAPAPG